MFWIQLRSVTLRQPAWPCIIPEVVSAVLRPGHSLLSFWRSCAMETGSVGWPVHPDMVQILWSPLLRWTGVSISGGQSGSPSVCAVKLKVSHQRFCTVVCWVDIAARTDDWHMYVYMLMHVDAASPCEPDPCLNGGLCEETSTEDFQCDCPPGWEGNLCQNSD